MFRRASHTGYIAPRTRCRFRIALVRDAVALLFQYDSTLPALSLPRASCMRLMYGSLMQWVLEDCNVQAVQPALAWRGHWWRPLTFADEDALRVSQDFVGNGVRDSSLMLDTCVLVRLRSVVVSYCGFLYDVFSQILGNAHKPFRGKFVLEL